MSGLKQGLDAIEPRPGTIIPLLDLDHGDLDG